MKRIFFFLFVVAAIFCSAGLKAAPESDLLQNCSKRTIEIKKEIAGDFNSSKLLCDETREVLKSVRHEASDIKWKKRFRYRKGFSKKFDFVFISASKEIKNQNRSLVFDVLSSKQYRFISQPAILGQRYKDYCFKISTLLI
jgi:hypothetical protein